MTEININGEIYVKKSELEKNSFATKLNDMPYCIIRTDSAGVFAGYLEKRNGKEVTIRKARRIWYWDGACSLSQLAKDGTAKPENCKFAVEVEKVELMEAIEIIECTQKAKESINEVAEWKI